MNYESYDNPKWEDAIKILQNINYYDSSLKYSKDDKYKNYYAIDCEMVWVNGKLDEPYYQDPFKIDYNPELKSGRKSMIHSVDKIAYFFKDTYNPDTKKGNKYGLRSNIQLDANDARSFIEFTYNTNKIPNTGYEYIEHPYDTEVTNTLSNNEKSRRIVAANKHLINFHEKVKNIRHGIAQITIVDWNGHVIYNKYIDPNINNDGSIEPISRVVWTSYFFSGIHQTFFNKYNNDGSTLNPYYRCPLIENKDKVRIYEKRLPDSDFVSLKDAKIFLKSLLFDQDSLGNYIPKKPLPRLIGHNLIGSDLPALQIDFKQDLLFDKKKMDKQDETIIRDTNFIFAKGYDPKYNSYQGPPLKDLVKNMLMIKVQGGIHDPSEDARASLAIYKLAEDKIEYYYSQNTISQFVIPNNYNIKDMLSILAFISNNISKGNDPSKYNLSNHKVILSYINYLIDNFYI